MKNYLILFVFLCACTFACQSGTQEQEQQAAEEQEVPPTPTPTPEVVEVVKTVYRSDGFYPGIASEYVEVHLDPENHKVVELLYWNVSDEQRQPLAIVTQTYEAGEISGYTGTLRFPDETEAIPFGIIEDRFTLTHAGERFQEFFYEEE